jgi:adenosylhomocysteine nucleosidase
MCQPDAIAKARADFPLMLAVEMEGAAIGQVCHMFQVPYLVVRAMSDIAGKEQVESFDAFIEVAGAHSAEVILAMLAKL